jgi:hypothetical protein
MRGFDAARTLCSEVYLRQYIWWDSNLNRIVDTFGGDKGGCVTSRGRLT